MITEQKINEAIILTQKQEENFYKIFELHDVNGVIDNRKIENFVSSLNNEIKKLERRIATAKQIIEILK